MKRSERAHSQGARRLQSTRQAALLIRTCPNHRAETVHSTPRWLAGRRRQRSHLHHSRSRAVAEHQCDLLRRRVGADRLQGLHAAGVHLLGLRPPALLEEQVAAPPQLVRRGKRSGYRRRTSSLGGACALHVGRHVVLFRLEAAATASEVRPLALRWLSAGRPCLRGCHHHNTSMCTHQPSSPGASECIGSDGATSWAHMKQAVAGEKTDPGTSHRVSVQGWEGCVPCAPRMAPACHPEGCC